MKLARALIDRVNRGGRPLRFLIAGGINTLVGLGMYPLLLWSSPYLHEHYLIGLGISQALCLAFTFATYKLFVFKSRDKTWRELFVFLSYYFINYAANWAALPLLVEAGGLPPIVAQLAFTIVLIIGSYFWHSRLTFGSAREP